MSQTEPGLDLATTYLVLAGPGDVRRIEVTPNFWQTVEQRTDLDGRLVGTFRYDADWSSWEMHPAGDELVIGLSGAIDLVLDTPDGERTVELRGANATAVVPRGVWHTANVVEPGVALHVTPGEGTQHKPR